MARWGLCGGHAICASPAPAKGSTIKREFRQAADAAEDVTNSRTLELLARAGFAASGVLHFLVGAIAIRLAMGGSGNADFSGAVSELASQPAGPFLLWASFAACAALALWQASDAIFDYNRLPTKEKAGKKAKAAAQALVFAGLALTLASFAMGTGSGGDNQTIRERLHCRRDEGPRRRGTAGPGGHGHRGHRSDLRRSGASRSPSKNT